MEDEFLGIVFGRPWLSGDADVLKGFELGRLGLACLSSEKIILHTHSFSEIPYLIKEIGEELFFKEVKDGRLKFVCQIENIAICNIGGGSEKATGTIIYPVELVELRESGSIEILKGLFKNDNVDLTEDKLHTLHTSITFTPKSLNQEIMSALIQDILDLRLRAVITTFFQKWFSTNEDILSFLKVHNETSIVFENVPDSCTFSGAKLQTLFFMLYSTYSQAAISDMVKAPQIFSDKIIFDLQLKIMQAKNNVRSEEFEKIIDTTTNSIDIPNISWLVSREILPISKLFSFKNSTEGKSFRNFLGSFKDSDEELINKVHQSLIKSLHGKTKWESAWESGISKIVRLTISTGVGLIPGPGTLLGLGATAVDTVIDKTIPRNYRPTVILDNMISKNTDAEIIAKEKESIAKYPSLVELKNRGFEASFYLINSEQTKAWIFLDKLGVNEHWELGLVLADKGALSYFEEFLSELKTYSLDIQRFVEILRNGATIQEQTTRFSQNPSTGESSLVLSYNIMSDSGPLNFASGEREFWNFIHGRGYFEHPRKYNEKISKILAELK